MTSNDDYVLRILQERGVVAPETVQAAEARERDPGKTLLDAMVESGALKEDDVLATIADQFGIRYVNIELDAVDPAIASELQSDIARKYGVVPLVREGDTLTVALSDPMGFDAVDSLRYVLHGVDVQAVLAPVAEVKAAMAKLYPDEAAAAVEERNDDLGTGGEEGDDDAPVIRLVQNILANAVQMKASDIHLEPMEKEVRVRYRIDGALRKMDSPPKRLQSAIISRIKIMSKIN